MRQPVGVIRSHDILGMTVLFLMPNPCPYTRVVYVVTVDYDISNGSPERLLAGIGYATHEGM
jgi:hypothetical protein